MQRYRLFGEALAAGSDGFESVIARAYAGKHRPVCLCRDDVELELYISSRHGTHVLSRWPGTGARHAPHCDHYEAPDFLTGKGQVQGSAVVEDENTGDVLLRFAFPLARGAARTAPASLTNDKPVVTSKGQRLSMRGLLHFLWDRAELTHWHPRMAGKRNWFVVRRALMNAALGCKTRGDDFHKTLFIPETFKLSDKDMIEGRRHGELAPARTSRDTIMVLIGEIKAIEAARFGEKIVVRHLPDWPFLMDDEMARRFHRRFAVEQELWRSQGDDGHLVMAASFSIGASGLPQLFEVSVVPMTPQWLPFESSDERSLLAKAVTEQRRFVKGLRFNLGLEKPVASVALTDTGAEASAVYLTRNLPDATYDDALAELMKTAGVSHHLWRPGDRLPSVSSHRRLLGRVVEAGPAPVD